MSDMLTMELGSDSVKVITHLENISWQVEKSINEELDDIALDMINYMKTEMRKTPKQSGTNRKSGHRASMPGKFPAIDTGVLVNSLEAVTTTEGVEIGTDIEYGKYLEHGTKKGSTFLMAARPFLKPGLESIDIEDRIRGSILRGMAI